MDIILVPSPTSLLYMHMITYFSLGLKGAGTVVCL